MTPIEKIHAGIIACTRSGANQASIALNNHIFGTSGIGIDSAAELLLAGGFDPPEDPNWFSAPLACNILNVF